MPLADPPSFHGPDGTEDATALLAPDGDHPNADGVQAIAQALVRAHAVQG
ncbi:hypothetical protein [Nigerium massiliense]|nr:hypothetical protein [Nigerium massiliense]